MLLRWMKLVGFGVKWVWIGWVINGNLNVWGV